jgi:hypothetical protein
MRFVCVGFGIREFPVREWPSADCSEWEADERCCTEVQARFGIVANEYGLLTVNTQQCLDDISDYILNQQASSDLVALSIPVEISRNYLRILSAKFAEPQLDLSRFHCCGLDVCDLGGLYSAFNHPEIEVFRGKSGLIPESDTHLALEVVQLANLLNTNSSHRVNVVTKVSSLRMGN